MPDLQTSLTYCTYCPKLCRHTCPVSNAEPREALVPQAKMAEMRLLRLGRIERTIENADPLYGCTGCGACTEACKHGITPGRHLFTGRAEARAAGAGHPALADLEPRLRGRGEQAVRALAEALPEVPRPVRAKAALLPGCDETVSSVRATLALAERAGAPLVLAAAPLGCGGYPLLAGGLPEPFRLHAEAMARALAGYERVVVSCPACAWAMRAEYPAHGVPLAPKVEHTAEHLAALADRLPTSAARAPAWYHDPCYLGRWSGVYDPPRKLLGLAREVREFSRRRAESACSGGGGLLEQTMPDVSTAIADARLEEVRATDVRELVTACPTCVRRLARDGVHSRSLAEVVEESTR